MAIQVTLASEAPEKVHGRITVPGTNRTGERADFFTEAMNTIEHHDAVAYFNPSRRVVCIDLTARGGGE